MDKTDMAGTWHCVWDGTLHPLQLQDGTPHTCLPFYCLPPCHYTPHIPFPPPPPLLHAYLTPHPLPLCVHSVQMEHGTPHEHLLYMLACRGRREKERRATPPPPPDLPTCFDLRAYPLVPHPLAWVPPPAQCLTALQPSAQTGTGLDWWWCWCLLVDPPYPPSLLAALAHMALPQAFSPSLLWPCCQKGYLPHCPCPALYNPLILKFQNFVFGDRKDGDKTGQRQWEDSLRHFGLDWDWTGTGGVVCATQACTACCTALAWHGILSSPLLSLSFLLSLSLLCLFLYTPHLPLLSPLLLLLCLPPSSHLFLTVHAHLHCLPFLGGLFELSPVVGDRPCSAPTSSAYVPFALAHTHLLPCLSPLLYLKFLPI